MEEAERPIVLKNGAVLLGHHVEEAEKHVTITFKFDRPVQKADLGELRALGQYDIMTKALRRKGWVSEDTEPKNLIAHQLSIGYEDNGKTWMFRFHTPDAKPEGEMVN